MKKKLIALVTALTLCAVVVVGATLAYFSTQTDEVTNVFTNKDDDTNPDPSIEEPNFPENPDITPGTVNPKDPFIQLNKQEAKGNYYVALKISGGSTLAELNNLAMILADDTDKTETILVPELDADGNRVYNADGTVKEIAKVVEKDYGIAKIYGWSDAFDYQIDLDAQGKGTGNVYAYYKGVLNTNTMYDGSNASAATNITPAVFEAVITNKNVQHFFDALDHDATDDKIFDIVVQGYVVAEENDTEIIGFDSNGQPEYGTWGSSKKAMQAAFPDVFYKKADTKEEFTDVNGQFPYKYPLSLPGNAPDFQPDRPFGTGVTVGPQG